MATGIQVSLEGMIGQIGESINGLNEAINRMHKFWTPNPRQSPIVRPFAGTVVSDGSTYVAADMGGPVGGRLWDVRRVGVYKGGGVDPFAVVSGVTVILAKVPGNIVTNKGVALANLVFTDLITAPGAVPNDVTFSAHEAQIKFPEHLVAIFKGTSNLDVYVATGQGEEYTESTLEFEVM